MKKQLGLLGVFAIGILSVGLAQAKSVSEILKGDVVCRNSVKAIAISQDLKVASILEAGVVTYHKISYRYNSGGQGQILVIKIQGLDGLGEETSISDIFELGHGSVAGRRDRQVGYGVEILERFLCQYLRL